MKIRIKLKTKDLLYYFSIENDKTFYDIIIFLKEIKNIIINDNNIILINKKKCLYNEIINKHLNENCIFENENCYISIKII